MNTTLDQNGRTLCCGALPERSFTAEGFIPGKQNCSKCGNWVVEEPTSNN